MSLVAELSSEKLAILQEAWTKLFTRLTNDSTTLSHWLTTFPDEASSTPDEASKHMLYELFDLAAFDDMDHTMLRYLRARKYNVDAALKMMIDTLIWRKTMDIRSIMQAGEEALQQRLVDASMYFIWGQDKQGRPIVFLNVGSFLPTHNQEEIDAFTRYLVYHMETARFFIGTKGVMALADLSDFGKKNIDMEMAKVFSAMFQNHYPEILGQALVVGSGFKMMVFEGAYSVMKLFLDPEVRRKIHLIKAKDIPEYIQPDFIPTSLEGVFEEKKIRQGAPPAAPSRTLDVAALKQKQLEAITAFKDLPWGAERDAKKQELRSLWLEMASTRPQNLYQRLGLITEEGVNWDRALQTST